MCKISRFVVSLQQSGLRHIFKKMSRLCYPQHAARTTPMWMNKNDGHKRSETDKYLMEPTKFAYKVCALCDEQSHTYNSPAETRREWDFQGKARLLRIWCNSIREFSFVCCCWCTSYIPYSLKIYIIHVQTDGRGWGGDVIHRINNN